MHRDKCNVCSTQVCYFKLLLVVLTFILVYLVICLVSLIDECHFTADACHYSEVFEQLYPQQGCRVIISECVFWFFGCLYEMTILGKIGSAADQKVEPVVQPVIVAAQTHQIAQPPVMIAQTAPQQIQQVPPVAQYVLWSGLL